MYLSFFVYFYLYVSVLVARGLICNSEGDKIPSPAFALNLYQAWTHKAFSPGLYLSLP